MDIANGSTHDIVMDAADAQRSGIPRGTAGADEWGFAWVKRFATATGCAWMRPRNVVSTFEVMREVYFTIMALVWVAQHMAPSSRRKQQGYQQGKTSSALLAIYAYRKLNHLVLVHL